MLVLDGQSPNKKAGDGPGRQKRAYVTLLGRSLWGFVNSYYAVLRHREYYPSRIIIFVEEVYKDKLDKGKMALLALSEEFGFIPSIDVELISESELFEAGSRIQMIVRELAENDYETALEITPGRKALVTGALISLSGMGLDHVFYLKVKDLEDGAKPYMMIPLQIQRQIDFIRKSEVAV
jgi:hypothetical protein